MVSTFGKYELHTGFMRIEADGVEFAGTWSAFEMLEDGMKRRIQDAWTTGRYPNEILASRAAEDEGTAFIRTLPP
ncbi:hypothetical protein HBF26_17045 [Luteibacter jiangsuensis]|uniref:DUF1488 family protein n=1 Tax=Luteibacter jiangsuensis TaxID=637577 RepID=A0ABX0Q9P1_9GAMM|nr:hypothetical protein [Luteibacter jiangsuensis]NID06605.1 hypothetical protein [Luteibacter jiangsuensis]